MSFVLDVSNFVQKAKANADLVPRKVALDFLRGVVFLTPVDTGRARGNWNTTLGAPSGTYDMNKFGGDLAVSEGEAVIAQAVAGGPSIWIDNNLPYIRRLEYGSWSKQAPNGMFRITLARIQASLGLL